MMKNILKNISSEKNSEDIISLFTIFSWAHLLFTFWTVNERIRSTRFEAITYWVSIVEVFLGELFYIKNKWWMLNLTWLSTIYIRDIVHYFIEYRFILNVIYLEKSNWLYWVNAFRTLHFNQTSKLQINLLSFLFKYSKLFTKLLQFYEYLA